jgi:allantoinase
MGTVPLMSDLIVSGERVVLPAGMQPASVHVRDGSIVAIGGYRDRHAGVPVVDAGALVVLPGLVDTHVHLNDPGRAEWEGFETGTRAAAAGGVTTIVDMPLNSVPATVDASAFGAKMQAARGRCAIDVGFWGGVVPGNASALEPLVARGVLGFKCFLSPSGVAEFEHVGERDLEIALPILARLGVPLLVHAEWPPALVEIDRSKDPRDYHTWLSSRPPASEQAAIDLLIRLGFQHRARIHIVHLASADTLASLRAARRAGADISVETCPHYLTFDAEHIPPGSTAFKCAPPIREARHRESLWAALAGGDIDLIATDHSPAPPALKSVDAGDFVTAWGGIASVQLGLEAVWTGAEARGITLEHLAGWLAAAPAKLAGLDDRKGAIAPGCDADLVFFDPDATAVVDPAALFHRHPMTPYAGMQLKGMIHKTMLRGEVVLEEGAFRSASSGRLLLERRRLDNARIGVS